MPALTVKAANAPPSINHAPREADLYVGPGRDLDRTAPIVENLGDRLIARFCSLLHCDRRLAQRKRVRGCGGMLFLMISKANRRSIRSAGHRLFKPTGSARVAYRRFDRRVDADIIAPGLLARLAGIPLYLPVLLQFARPAGRAGNRLGWRFEVGPQRTIC